MCQCTSCKYTDSFYARGFSEWPRGNPAGKRSATDYAAHVRYSKLWGKGREPMPVNASPFPCNGTTWRDPHTNYHFPAPQLGMTAYVAEFERKNGLRSSQPVKLQNAA